MQSLLGPNLHVPSNTIQPPRTLSQNCAWVRPALAMAVLSPTAFAQTVIPSVVTACNTCTSYQDMVYHAQTIVSQVGVGLTPPGFAPGNITQPGTTKIIVSSNKAPISFVFDYTATRGSVGGFLSQVVYYNYTIVPTTAFPATDLGAARQDMAIYKALRASGLPKVELPPRAIDGSSIDISRLDAYETIQAFISYTLFTPDVASLRQRTLPGLLNWSLTPSIKISYKGKSYILYQDDTFTVKDAQGNEVEFRVELGTFMGQPGYLRLKPETIKLAPTSNQTAPPPAPTPGSFSTSSISSLNPNTLDFTGIPIYNISGPSLPGRVPGGEIWQDGQLIWKFSWYDIG